jgi:nicotinamidase/pyrazinamidase
MRTVFLDVDTQLDFVVPAGALYAPGAEGILPMVARLNEFAVRSGGLLISTMDAHAENDPEFQAWPAHCVKGALGQRKAAETLVGPSQRFLEKQSVDCFTVPALEEMLREYAPERCIVYGVVTEICVFHAARGLVDRGYRVEIVEDAVKELDAARAEAMRGEFRFVRASLILGD